MTDELYPQKRKRSAEERASIAARRAEVAKLTLRGWDVRDIAAVLKVHPRKVESDLRYAAAQWTMKYVDDVNSVKAKAIARCELLIREALTAWQRSTQDRVKHRRGTAANGNAIESEERTGQAGDPGFLEVVLRAQTQQLNLCGIRPVFEDEARQAEEYFQLDVKRLPKEQLAALGQALMDCHDALNPKSLEYAEIEAEFLKEEASQRDRRENGKQEPTNGHASQDAI